MKAYGYSPHLHSAIKKYGKEGFTFVILENVSTESIAKTREIFYIKKYNSYKHGYNLTLGGDGTTGYKHTKMARRKISQSLIGNKRALGNKNCLGRKHSEESKRKMRIAHRGMRKPWMIKRNQATARTYEVTWPSGQKEIIVNLTQFCKKHNLHNGAMSMVANGKQGTHKGIKIILLSDNDRQ